MIQFDHEAYKRLVSDTIGSPTSAMEVKAIILTYIMYANENEINELSEYPDELSKL